MLKNKKFVVFLSLFMIFVLTIPAFALEIQPLGMDCPNCSEIVTNSEVLIRLMSALSTLARGVQ